MQNPDQTEAESQEAQIETLNERLNQCADIWNALRGTDAFESRAYFLWNNAIRPVYEEKMPRNAKFAVEVTETAYNQWSEKIPHLSIDQGESTKFFLFFDPPLDSSDPAAKKLNRIVLDLALETATQPPVCGFMLSTSTKDGPKFLNETPRGGISSKEVLGFQIQPKAT